MEHSPNIRQ